MMSKFWNGGQRALLFATKAKSLWVVPARKSTLLPPTQYDTPVFKRLWPGHAVVHNWEVIPLFTVTGIAMFILFFSIGWAIKNKVDVVFTTHSRDNISRTMDLRNPSCHKLLTINQKYEPWDEMQDALDAVVIAEKRHRVRMELAKKCFPQP